MFASCALLGAEKEQDACLDGRVYRYTIKGMEGMLYHWRAENGTVINKDTLNDTVYVRWNGPGTYKLKVFGEYDGCFTDWKELKVKLHNAPYFSLGDNVDICEGESYTFNPDFGKVTSVKWHDGSVGTLTVDSSQKVWASILNEFGCKASDTVHVNVRKLPYIDLGPDTMLCGDQTMVLNSLSAIYDGTLYEWKTPNPNRNYLHDPSIEIGNGEAEYSVKVTDIYGCVSSDTIRVFKCSNVFDRNKISVAFTPNGDTYNDLWEIQGLADEFPNVVVDVYDRGGRLVFRSDKGYTKPWDGRDKGNNTLLPIASYYYIIYLNNKENDKIPGTLNIIR